VVDAIRLASQPTVRQASREGSGVDDDDHAQLPAPRVRHSQKHRTEFTGRRSAPTLTGFQRRDGALSR